MKGTTRKLASLFRVKGKGKPSTDRQWMAGTHKAYRRLKGSKAYRQDLLKEHEQYRKAGKVETNYSTRFKKK